MSTIHKGENYSYISLWKQPKCLKEVINRSLEYVWIVNHSPSKYVDQWINCRTQIKKDGLIRDLLVREMRYDIQMSTYDFVGLCEEFSDVGLIMFQLIHPVPPTLFYYKITENKRKRILQENGVKLGVEFCDPDDIGVIWSTDKDYIETLLEQKEIRDLVR